MSKWPLHTSAVQDSRKSDIETLIREHYREWCLHAFSYLKSMDEAKDVVQDVLLRILSREEVKKIPNNYIVVAIKNASLTKIRDTKEIVPIDDKALSYLNSGAISPQEKLEGSEAREKLYGAIDQLPTQCRKVFYLCAVQGLKYSSAAETLGISTNTVKTQMKIAYKNLRLSLKDTYFSLLLLVLFL